MSRVRKRLLADQGFGLIELLIAMIILNVGILAIVASFNAGIITLNRASRVTTAAVLADQQMELYRGITYGSIRLGSATIPSSAEPPAGVGAATGVPGVTGTAGTAGAGVVAAGSEAVLDEPPPNMLMIFGAWKISTPTRASPSTPAMIFWRLALALGSNFAITRPPSRSPEAGSAQAQVQEREQDWQQLRLPRRGHQFRRRRHPHRAWP